MRLSAAVVKWPLIVLALAVICGGFAPAAFAGLATTPLALNDGFGPDAGRWRGTVSFDQNPIGFGFNDEVEGVIEWAAFAPGKFAQYLAAEHPLAVDPSALGEVVYAYQLVSLAKAVPGVSVLSVGYDNGDEPMIGSVLPTSVAQTGGSLSSSADAQVTQAVWNFVGPSLAAGGSSSILIFSSVFSPELDNIQVTSGLASSGGQAASISDRIFEFEIPEPASASLLALAVAVVFGVRRRR
jgi:hypothetical protein